MFHVCWYGWNVKLQQKQSWKSTVTIRDCAMTCESIKLLIPSTINTHATNKCKLPTWSKCRRYSWQCQEGQKYDELHGCRCNVCPGPVTPSLGIHQKTVDVYSCMCVCMSVWLSVCVYVVLLSFLRSKTLPHHKLFIYLTVTSLTSIYFHPRIKSTDHIKWPYKMS